MAKKSNYHADSIDSVGENGAGAAPDLKPYSKNTESEGSAMHDLVPNHYEPTHVIHKGHGGISGASIDGYHKK